MVSTSSRTLSSDGLTSKASSSLLFCGSYETLPPIPAQIWPHFPALCEWLQFAQLLETTKTAKSRCQTEASLDRSSPGGANMRIRTSFFSRITVVLLLMLAGAPAAFSQTDLARWDIISIAFGIPPALNTVSPGGVTFAKALDGSKIKLTGSGTFVASAGRLGGSGPVTGGGTWETFSPTKVSLSNG